MSETLSHREQAFLEYRNAEWNKGQHVVIYREPWEKGYDAALTLAQELAEALERCTDYRLRYLTTDQLEPARNTLARYRAAVSEPGHDFSSPYNNLGVNENWEEDA